ncbi:hypothetical protein AVEN_129180-1 [Araneus ventricosus]|uniref:Uncharacterized protein n=1 Tax=Araneus ventricosus TaxID=182803 RepID=A0A4Y2C0J5_ARAVE|nr:hypothetical protein AVEN_129180-1 [Araneus ventricosus]
MLLLWLERDIYRVLTTYRGMEANVSDLGDHFGDKFGDLGDKTKILKNAGIFSISLLVAEIWRIYYMILCDVTSCQKRYKNPDLLSCDKIVFERLRSSKNLFGDLFALQIGQLLDAERYYCYCY